MNTNVNMETDMHKDVIKLWHQQANFGVGVCSQFHYDVPVHLNTVNVLYSEALYGTGTVQRRYTKNHWRRLVVYNRVKFFL
jgi:hypothetical protein